MGADGVVAGTAAAEIVEDRLLRIDEATFGRTFAPAVGDRGDAIAGAPASM